MNFDESVSYLYGLGHETLAVKLGLENVTRLLRRLGDPQGRFPSVQIAGTNGKGSTAAMLDSIARAAGVRAGLYTSPHLVSVTERVRVGGLEISRDEFARHATRVREAAEEVGRESGALPTFFEQVTGVALSAFADEKVEVAVLETGLGGRLDATTAAGARWVAVTPVALDHQEYLGDTLAGIAGEKAAIIRPGARAVVAPQEPEALEVILRRCRESGVEPRFTTEEAEVEEAGADGRLRVSIRTARAEYAGVRLALRGRHQLVNAAVAVALAEMLAEDGYSISREEIVEGLETAEHAGRLELDERTRPPILYDGAHNVAGARALRAYLDEFAPREGVTLVFGAMRDKELGEIGRVLFPAARHLVLTRPESPRAASVEELLRAVPVPPSSSTIALAPSSRDAMTIARTHTPPEGLVCVTGSLYLVGEVKAQLEHNDGES
ncbi:MAG TPA: folylpolyglutamate synthase/dihydrofolate synthase family protein [Pyrinomonadaceae bacterium]|nr:folylpolyglutamate synthase/dihydrofolate synthase family protein [Pyrinomonadaceae bacterium]